MSEDPELDRFLRWCAQNPAALARLHPEARRLLDERVLLEGSGSKDWPRGVIALGTDADQLASLASQNDTTRPDKA